MSPSSVAESVLSAYAEFRAMTTLELRREAYDRIQPPPPAGARHEVVQLGSGSGEWTTVPSSGDRVVVLVHGGGFVVGSSFGYRGMAARVADAARARVLTVDYSLSPEHPFPTAFEQVRDAYTAAVRDALIVPATTVVLGDSAGGGLALAALQALRDDGSEQDLPAGYVGLAPVVDLTQSSDTWDTLAQTDPINARERGAANFDRYLQGASRDDPRASPLFADLTGLPPMLLQVGSADVMLGETFRLAEQAREAGVRVELQVAHGMPHVYQMFPHLFSQAERDVLAIGEFVLATTSTSTKELS